MKKKCSRCGELKSLIDFYKSTRDGIQSHCKQCVRQRVSERWRKLIKTDGFRKKELKRQTEWKKTNIIKVKQVNKLWHQKVRLEVLVAYSSKIPKCKCCGEKELKFLSIDHINGGGNKHRQEIKRDGGGYYTWLRSKGFPSGYQVLCYNCNCSKGFYGVCPHKLKTK